MFDPRITPYGSLWRAAFAVAVFDLQRETGDQRQLTREWLHEMLSKFGALDAIGKLSAWLDRGDLAARDQLRRMFAASHATPYKPGDTDPAALDDGERAEQHRRRGKESATRHAERVSAGVAADRLANGLDLAAKRVAAPPATAPRTTSAATGRKEASPFMFYRSLGDSKRAAAASTVPRPEDTAMKPQRVKPAKPTKPAKRAKTRPATLTKRAEAAIRKRDRQRKRMGEAHARRWRRMTPEERAARRARMSEAQRASWAALDDGGRAARVAAIAAGRERKRIARLERVAALRAEAMAAFALVRDPKVAPQSAPNDLAGR